MTEATHVPSVLDPDLCLPDESECADQRAPAPWTPHAVMVAVFFAVLIAGVLLG